MAYQRRQENSLEHAASLIEEIGAGRIAPVYLLHGDESMLIEEVIGALREQLIAPGMEALDHQRHDPDGAPNRLDFAKIADELATPPFMSPRRLIEIRNSALFRSGAGQGAANQEGLARLLGAVNPASCLVFREARIDRRLTRWRRAFDEVGASSAARPSAPRRPLPVGWEILSARGLRLKRQALDSLVDRCNRDMLLLKQELEKLSLFAEAEGKDRLDLFDVDRVAIRDMRGTIFDLTDRISEGRTSEALRQFRVLEANGESQLGMLAMLSRHFRQLYCALEMDEQRLAQTLPVPPFVARRLREQARRFDGRRLAALIGACYDSDVAIKSGKLQDSAALEILLAQAGRAAAWRGG